MNRIRVYITYANVMATVAVFVALGGTSYATGVMLKRDSVRSEHIANGQVQRQDLGYGAVDSARVQDGSLQRRDFGGLIDADRLGGLPSWAFQRRGTDTVCKPGQKMTGIYPSGNVTCADDAVGTPGGGGGDLGETMLARHAELTGPGTTDLVAFDGRFRITLTCFANGAQPDIENLSDTPLEVWLDSSSGSPLYSSLGNGQSMSSATSVSLVDEEPQRAIYQGVDQGRPFTAIVMTAVPDAGTCHGNARILLGP